MSLVSLGYRLMRCCLTHTARIVVCEVGEHQRSRSQPALQLALWRDGANRNIKIWWHSQPLRGKQRSRQNAKRERKREIKLERTRKLANVTCQSTYVRKKCSQSTGTCRTLWMGMRKAAVSERHLCKNCNCCLPQAGGMSLNRILFQSKVHLYFCTTNSSAWINALTQMTSSYSLIAYLGSLPSSSANSATVQSEHKLTAYKMWAYF